jgi:O-Antigen ligase
MNEDEADLDGLGCPAVIVRRRGGFGFQRISVRKVFVARAALYLASAYITLTTADVDIARVPLKLFVVALALIGWLAVYRPWMRSWRSYPFAIPVLVGGIVIPVAWFALAILLHHRHDPAQPDNTSYAIQQASRFVYLLLYFPILDEVKRCGAIAGREHDRELRAHGVWLWPTLALCAISLLFFLGHALLGLNYDGGNVGPFHGIVALEITGVFRVFLADDVMIIPATALVLGLIRNKEAGNLASGVIFALLATAYVAHTRGLWLGMLIALAVVLLVSRVPRAPSVRRRAATIFITTLFVAAFIVNADPNASHSSTSLLTHRNELSTSYRLEQAPQLLSGFRRHVLFGSGLGATLPSGYRRSTATPWSFELTYLQLLFQLGSVGLLLLLAVPAWALYRAARALGGADPEQRIAIAAATGGLVGLLFTAGSNPYLISSVGMLALAVLMVMVERAAIPLAEPLASAIPAEAGGSMLSLSLIASSRLRHVFASAKSAVRPGRPTTIIAVSALIVVLGVAEFARSRQLSVPKPGNQQVAPSRLAPVSAPRRVLALPASFLSDRSATLVSDPERAAPDYDLWSVSSASGSLQVSRWHLGNTKILVGPVIPGGPAPRGSNVQFGIVGLGPAHPELLGVMTSVGSSLHIELRDLTDNGHILVAGSTPALPLLPGYIRDIGLASWSGTASPDLIVVDRSVSAPVIHIRIFSASAAFRQQILDVTVPRGPFSAAAFSILIGSVSSPGADLTLVSRTATSSSHTEVHVLLGSQAFQNYVEQSPVNLQASVPSKIPFLLSHEGILPVIYVVDRTTGLLEVAQIA